MHNVESQLSISRLTEVPKDYLMIQSVEISNFRGFKRVSLSGLPRFNILIGGSGSGKTAFLEALWIQGGISPEIYFRMRGFRGMADPVVQLGERFSYEAFFSDIFLDPLLEQGASIQLIDSGLGERSLTISYASSAQTVVDITKPQIVSPGSSPTPRPLVFRWKVREEIYELPLKVAGGQIVMDKGPEPYPTVFFASSHVQTSRETAERLSALSISGETEKIIQTIRKIYPHVITLTSEGIAGQQMIWVSVQGLKRKIPAGVISSGINKLIGILLWISQNRGGVILTDEIENGFYFLDYGNVFGTIKEFCDEYSVQLFATTHNWEFLKAVASVLQDRQDDLSMLKTSFANGRCHVSQMEGVSMVAAIEQDIDVRK
jgi:hypothetical protein